MPGVRALLEALEDHGLLLQTDPKLPSVAVLVAGEPVKGSWWAHRKAHDIFRATCELADHPDVLVSKLVSGKTTHVHRALWPAVVAAGRAREPWQLAGLSREARALLRRVDREGRLEATGAATRDLEGVLLIYSEQFHTGAGSHAKIVESWDHWAKRTRFRARLPAPADARRQLEAAVGALNQRFGGRGRLPWMAPAAAAPKLRATGLTSSPMM
ncbi:MAG TPA: hypothetical protein VEU62_18550 [Bryobacterales bacterium]|nr:hypothetical protein [Bryobacterales bacterium]